jgi:PAS domain S-box-containing protein
MNYIVSYCHLLTAVIYAVLGIIIISKDYRSRLNQACAAIFACFFLWSFSFVWIHHPDTSMATAKFFGSIASIGWICFGFFHLCFAWIFSRRRPFRFFKPLLVFSIVVPAVLLYLQLTKSALFSGQVHRDFGWVSIWSTSAWTYAFFVYYLATVFTGLLILDDYRRRIESPIIRRQLLVLSLTGAVSIILGSLSNVLLLLITQSYPPVADTVALIWAIGLSYVVTKYRMFDITPFIAAQRIVTVMKDLLFLLDTNGRIISVNPSAAETLACSAESLIGRPFLDVIAAPESERLHIAQTIRQSPILREETVVAFQSGPSTAVALSTSLIPGTGVVCMAHDISLQKQRTELLREAKKRLESEVSRATDELREINVRLTREVAERKQAAAALTETEERFRVIFEHAPDGIFLADFKGTFVDVNDEVRRVIGFGEKELEGKNLLDLGVLHGADLDKITEILDENRLGKAALTREVTVFRNDGDGVPVEINAHPVAIGGRDLTLGVIRNLTYRKKAEEEAEDLKRELHQAQKMDAIGRLAGGIAHDFNNLLGGIMGYAGLLRNKLLPDSPSEAGIVQKIIDVARQASNRTAQLLAFARKGKYQVTPIPLHEVIDDVVGLLENTIDRKITLVKNYQAHASTVMGDRSQLHSALLNLGVNARDAMLDAGAITFSTDVVHIGEELAHNYPYAIDPGTFLKITVEDNGVGMDEKTRSRAFEPFFSTKKAGKGTGLGLASVYGTIKHHSGFIELWSEEGKGSRFTICLPLSTEQVSVQQTRQVAEAAPCSRRQGTILVVDDVLIVREIAADVLSDLGYSVNGCGDGIEALAWFKEHHGECDLVILDLTMPKLSGKDCFRAMREIKPALKAIITSGHAMDNDIGELLSEGVLAFLQKPFEIEQLSRTVQRVLS